MMRWAAGLVVALAATGGPAFAQSGDVPVADTLGANFDAEHPGTGDASLFDYLIGEWSFRFQNRGDNGTFNPARRGHWKAWKTHDGLMVEDEWSLDPPGNEPRRVLTSYRAWNPERHLWEMVGVVPGEGRFDPGTAWGSGNERLLVQRYGSYTVRIRYYQITATHFLWRADGSGDGGRTWQRDISKMEATRTR